MFRAQTLQRHRADRRCGADRRLRQGAAACADAVDHHRVGADARAAEQRHARDHGDRAGAGRHARAERHDGAVHDHARTRRSGGSADDERRRHDDVLRRPNSGIADIRATSGAATGGEGTTATNLVEITIGAAAVNTVITLRANPGSVGPNGGTVELIATVVGESGQPLEGVLVTFNDRPGVAGLDDRRDQCERRGADDADNEPADDRDARPPARRPAPTSRSPSAAGPIVTITCATVTAGTEPARPCQASAVEQHRDGGLHRDESDRKQRSAHGDDSTSATAPRRPRKPGRRHSDGAPTPTADRTTSNPRSYTATVLATDINGESTSASVTVLVTPRPTRLRSACHADCRRAHQRPAHGQRWTFTADRTGGGEGGTGNAPIQSYTWDFGDGDDGDDVGQHTSHVYETEPARSAAERVR